MRLITGDECGLLKECLPELAKSKTADTDHKTPVISDQGHVRINNGDISSRRRGVVALAWTEPEADKQFSSLHMDGTVELWERSVSNKTHSFGGYRPCRKFDNIFGEADTTSLDVAMDPLTRPLGMSRFTSKDGNCRLCASNMQGKIVIINPTENHSGDPILSTFSVFKESPHTDKSAIQYPLASAMTVDTKFSRVAAGGKDRETVLWDVNTAQQVWKAKNLPPDKQTLLQPQVWPTAIHIMDDSVDDSIGSGGGQILAVGSAHREVRIYDIRVGHGNHQAAVRRPISVTPFGLVEHRVTSLCQIDTYRLAVGDAAGFLHAIDLRKLGKKERVRKSIHQVVGTHGRFVGPAGSVQQIVKHGALPRMAVVGLDRMLRVYDTEKRKELTCMYLKQRLKCVLMGQERDAVDEETEGDLLEDRDLDQEDVVDVYVDSDLEEEEANGGSDESSSDSDDSEDEPDVVVQHSQKKRRQ